VKERHDVHAGSSEASVVKADLLHFVRRNSFPHATLESDSALLGNAAESFEADELAHGLDEGHSDRLRAWDKSISSDAAACNA
jgi:hypothetical protein